VTEELVDCSGGEDFSPEGALQRKLEALDACMARHAVPRTIIFCNRIETCRVVENHLKRKDRSARQCLPLAAHAAIAADKRSHNLAAFLFPPQEGQPARVLVCTDRCAPRVSVGPGNRIIRMGNRIICTAYGAHRVCWCESHGAASHSP
jgi:ATP-dependent RNA helicase DDX18/HAS1